MPRTPGQSRYVQAIAEHDIVFCIGPAGTGKTYLAVAMAVASLKQERIRKIVLVRPAVEAGESLGYLPGDLQAKINPYLRPLLDALREMMDYDQIRRYTDQDLIEVIPLAYMRGRTLNDAFIILDEAQNTTVSQMKMFLTRMGRGSKIVVSGDTTQIDLPAHATSGLVDAMRRLRRIKGLAQVSLTNADIVRHRLVQDIVRAYEEGSKRRQHDRLNDNHVHRFQENLRVPRGSCHFDRRLAALPACGSRAQHLDVLLRVGMCLATARALVGGDQGLGAAVYLPRR